MFTGGHFGRLFFCFGPATAGSLTQKEVHLYGSSRLGIKNCSVNVQSGNLPLSSQGYAAVVRGEQFFELSNHLQNVLVTVSDKKIQQSAGGITVDYYTADVVTANDYYPFGMMMPGRKYRAVSTAYRFGFNGKEQADEVYGEGNAYDFGARVLDTRIGRWFAMDPKDKAYVSSYHYSANNPVNYIDPDGKDEIHFFYRTKVKTSSFRGVTYETIEKYIVVIPSEGAHRFYTHNYTEDAQGNSLGGGSVKQLETFSGNDKSKIASNFQRFPGALDKMLAPYQSYTEISQAGSGRSQKMKNIDLLNELKGYVKKNEQDSEECMTLLYLGLSEFLGVEKLVGAVFNRLGILSRLQRFKSYLLESTLPPSRTGSLLGSINNGNLLMLNAANRTGKFDYVITQGGEFLIGSKHTYLSGGLRVYAAGEIKLQNGVIKSINNLSGHYLPSIKASTNFLEIFKAVNVDVSKATLRIYNANGRLAKIL